MHEQTPADPRTPAARNAAVDKLRNLTMQVALVSTAGVGAFGYIAAQTYSGHATPAATEPTGASSTNRSTGVERTDNEDEDDASSSNSSEASRSSRSSGTLLPSTTTPQTTTRHAHVTTGGS
jgi:hypothetical protein